METHKFSSPQCHLFKTKLDMVRRIIWTDVAPPIWATVLLTLELLLHNTKFFMICEICHFVAISLLLHRLGSHRILGKQPSALSLHKHTKGILKVVLGGKLSSRIMFRIVDKLPPKLEIGRAHV